MAQIYPFAPARRGELTPSLLGYECIAPSGFRGRGLLCLVQLSPPQHGTVFPAQQPSSQACDNFTPVLLFDDPAGTLDNLLFSPNARLVAEQHGEGFVHRLTSINDLHYINIVSTELQEKRLILAAHDAAWSAALGRSLQFPRAPGPEHKTLTTPIHRQGYLHVQPPRPEDAIPALLLNQERAEFTISALHRVLPAPANFDAQRFLDQARLFFQIEPLPAALTVERAQYLLTHGNELGPALIALSDGKAHLLKARLDVLEALLPSAASDLPSAASDLPFAASDLELLELLLQRALHLDLRATEAVSEISAAICAVRDGAPLAFLLNPPSLPQIQHAAFLRTPLPADSFRIFPQAPEDWVRDFTSVRQ
ncbi:MAG: hypothetical protein ABI383_13950 [Acidobacteriaceae bacterium]